MGKRKGKRQSASSAEPAKTPAGRHSLATLKAKAKVKEARLEELDKAAAWCIENKKTPYDAAIVALARAAGGSAHRRGVGCGRTRRGRPPIKHESVCVRRRTGHGAKI